MRVPVVDVASAFQQERRSQVSVCARLLCTWREEGTAAICNKYDVCKVHVVECVCACVRAALAITQQAYLKQAHDLSCVDLNLFRKMLL